MSQFWHALACLASMALAFTLGGLFGFCVHAMLQSEGWPTGETCANDGESCDSIQYSPDLWSTTATTGYPATASSGRLVSASSTRSRAGRAGRRTTLRSPR